MDGTEHLVYRDLEKGHTQTKETFYLMSPTPTTILLFRYIAN